MKTVRSILRTALLLILGLALGVRLYLWNAQSLMGNTMPMPFGYGAAVVLSGSMEPTFSAGDLIVVQETDVLSVGDIVVYQSGGSLVVHRIIQAGEEAIITQGDANNVDDGVIQRSAVKGKVLFWIPGLGNIVSFLKTPAGTLCLLAAAFALIELPRRQERRKDEEARQKIIDEINRLKNEQQK